MEHHMPVPLLGAPIFFLPPLGPSRGVLRAWGSAARTSSGLRFFFFSRFSKGEAASPAFDRSECG